jgi:hypothetical protein
LVIAWAAVTIAWAAKTIILFCKSTLQSLSDGFGFVLLCYKLVGSCFNQKVCDTCCPFQYFSERQCIADEPGRTETALLDIEKSTANTQRLGSESVPGYASNTTLQHHADAAAPRFQIEQSAQTKDWINELGVLLPQARESRLKDGAT